MKEACVIKKNRFITALFITAGMIALLVGVPVKASEFLDMDKSSGYARESIEYLAEKKIITGDAGLFNPKATVTRAQMAALIVRAMGTDLSETPEVPDFKDIEPTHWAYKYIEAAYRNGITEGVSKAEFSPDAKCTREQMITMFVRALRLSDQYTENRSSFRHILPLYDYRDISTWARGTVEFSLSSNLMKGTGNNTFDPLGVASKEQVAVMICRYMKNKINVSGGIPDIELYKALQDASKAPYKGSFATDFFVSRQDVKSGLTTSSNTVKLDGSSDGTKIRINGTSQVDSSTAAGDTSTYELFGINGRRYKKSSDSGKWVLSKVDEMKALSGFGITGKQWDGKPMSDTLNGKLLNAYSALSIEKAGAATIDGENVIKFTINPVPYELDQGLKELLPQNKALNKEGIYFDDVTVEIYVNSQDRIVLETLKYKDSVLSSLQNTRLDASISIHFNNDGNSAKVETPADFAEQPVPDSQMNNRLVQFPDQSLGKLVRDILDKDKVTEADMLQFTELDGSFLNIGNLTGLEYATNLERLVLAYNWWIYTPGAGTISHLTKLKYLDLTGNKIDDLSFADSLQELQYIDISQNYISSIEPLTHLNHLNELRLVNNMRDVDLNELPRIRNLTRLSLGQMNNSDVNVINPQKVKEELNIISGLSRLEELSMEGFELQDIAPLKVLVNLKKLNLSSNRITNTDALSNMKQLTELNLQYNQITDLNGLAGLDTLKRLSLAFNLISDVTPLTGLKNLEYLGLDFNHIKDIRPLKELPNLKALGIQQNPISGP